MEFSLRLKTGRFRRVWIVEEEGKVVEASPLPGFSQESIEDTKKGIGAAWNFAKGCFGARLKDGKVELTKLLFANSPDFLADFEAAYDSGYRTFKIKVQTLFDLEKIPKRGRLRIDANMAWSADEAMRAGQILKDHPVDYFEEPLRMGEDFFRFSLKFPFPLAADERLMTGEIPRGASVAVLKPTVLGWDETLRLGSLAETAVLSGAYESGVATRWICQMAATYFSQQALGVDTYHLLEEDLLFPRLPLTAKLHTEDLKQCQLMCPVRS